MVVSRRVLICGSLSLVVLSAIAVPAAGAAVKGPAAARTLKVGAPVTNARWREGWLRPGADIRFTGTVGAASTLTAVLRPLDRPGVVTSQATFEVTAAGPFTKHLRLPPRPLPGRYRLRVAGMSGATALRPVDVSVTIPAPPEGVLDQAEVGTTTNGPWLLYKSGSPPVVHGSHKELWMRFRFLYPPTGKNIELVWKMRWHTVVGKVFKLYKDTLDTSVSSANPLPAGHWSAVLRIDGRVAKKMDVIVR